MATQVGTECELARIPRELSRHVVAPHFARGAAEQGKALICLVRMRPKERFTIRNLSWLKSLSGVTYGVGRGVGIAHYG
jgi:hypothetical protein